MSVFQLSKQQNRTRTTSLTVLGTPPNRTRTKKFPLEELRGGCFLSWVLIWESTENRDVHRLEPYTKPYSDTSWFLPYQRNGQQTSWFLHLGYESADHLTKYVPKPRPGKVLKRVLWKVLAPNGVPRKVPRKCFGVPSPVFSTEPRARKRFFGTFVWNRHFPKHPWQPIPP